MSTATAFLITLYFAIIFVAFGIGAAVLLAYGAYGLMLLHEGVWKIINRKRGIQ